MRYGNKEWSRVEKGIYKSNDGNWLFQFKINNRLYRINATKKYDVKNKNQAVRKFSIAKAQILDNNDLGKLRTLDYYMSLHIKEISNKNTLSTYKVHWTNRINSMIGHLRVDQITTDIITQVMESRKYKNKSQAVKIRVKFILNPIFKQLMREGKLRYNPLESVQAFNGYKKERRKPLKDRLMLRESELKEVPRILYLEILKLEQMKRVYYLFSLMLARRRDEILQYRTDDIKDGYLHVKSEYMKGKKANGSSEILKLPEEIIRELASLKKQPDGRIIKMHFTWASTFFSKELLRNTVFYNKGFVLHDLRSLFANVMVIECKTDYWLLDMCLSHVQKGSGSHYIHNSETRRWETFEQYWQLIRGQNSTIE